MRRLLRVLLFVASIGAPVVITLTSADVSATATQSSPYTFEQTYGTALRLLRVDLGCKITEKDQDNGYILFDYTSPESGKRVHHGSIEVVRRKQGTHVTVQLPTLPQYHEQMIVDALMKKLSTEHGEPPAREKDKEKDKEKSPAAPPADGGADGG